MRSQKTQRNLLRAIHRGSPTRQDLSSLEPLAEVEGALLVVEVLHAPHPEGLSLLLVVGGEHFCKKKTDTGQHQHMPSHNSPHVGSAAGNAGYYTASATPMLVQRPEP